VHDDVRIHPRGDDVAGPWFRHVERDDVDRAHRCWLGPRWIADVDVHTEDLRSMGGEGAGDRLPDAPAAARHDGTQPGEQRAGGGQHRTSSV
jgi:hypothetical protein